MELQHNPAHLPATHGGRLPRVAACAAVLPALLLSSCRKEGAGGAPPAVPPNPHLVRLIEVSVEQPAAERVDREAASLRVSSPHLKDCPLRGEASKSKHIALVPPPHRTTDTTEYLNAFMLEGEGAKRAVWPVALERGMVDTVRATVTCYGVAVERARAVLLDEALAPLDAADWTEFSQRREPRVLEFAFPPAKAGAPGRIGGVAIEFEGRSGTHCGITALEVRETSLAARLPSLAAPSSIVAATQARTAAALVEGSPWHANVALEGAARLHLSAHWPQLAAWHGPLPRLSVTTRVAGEEATQEVALPAGLEAKWVSFDVTLGRPGAALQEVTLAIHDDQAEQLGALLLGGATLTTPMAAPRTVLLITSDTHRADHLGAASAPSIVTTPAIDALASRGLYFTDCQSTTNVTNPSHVAIMTGLHPRDTQIVDNTTALNDQVTTLAEHFQAAGYRTFAAISTQHLGHDQSGLGQGFDRFESTREFKRRGDAAIATVMDWIANADGESVFAWVHLFDAHAPYMPPNELIERHYTGDPRDPSKTLDLGGVPPPWWVKVAGIRDVQYVNALYRGEVEMVDRALQPLLELPRVKEGIVAFTADHGESLGMRKIWWDHVGLYPPNLQVPLVIAAPGVAPQRLSHPVQQIDLGRTLLDLVGLPMEFPGKNLVELAAGPAPNEPRFALSSHGTQASVTSGDWFLVLDLVSFVDPSMGDEFEAGRVQLFDRRAGVDNEADVAMQELERTRKMRKALLNWLQAASGEALGAAVELSAEAAANLEALGYGGGGGRTQELWWNPAGIPAKWLEPFGER